jgi:integrase/recombinase XerD
MQVSQAVDEYRYAILRLAPKTQQWYLEKLSVFADWCEQEQIPLENLKAAHIRRFIDELRTRINPQTHKPISSYTRHGYAQTLKTFLNWCTREEGLDELVSDKLPRRVEMPRIEQKVIETFTADQIKRLFAATEKEYNRSLTMRDRAILAVLLDCGIRASELCGLTMENVFITPNDAYIKVLGKGTKWRECPVGKEARATLHRYITRYRHAPKDEPHVFLNRANKPLTPNGLDQILYRLRDWAHIKGVRCSAHTARHTYSVSFLTAGGDIYTLSRLLGHTSVQVTENYLRAFKARDARKKGLSVLDQMK